MVFSALKKYNIIATEKIFIYKLKDFTLNLTWAVNWEKGVTISIQALIKTAKTNTQLLL